MSIGSGRRRAVQVACALAVAWATAPSGAQPASSDSGATPLALSGVPFHHHWDPTRDHDVSSTYQRARDQYIATWGFAPGQQTKPVAGSFPIIRWSSIGPVRIAEAGVVQSYLNASGRINSIAIHPTDPNTIYIGAADGGVWKTTDGGAGWLPLTDGQCSLEIGAIAVDPVSPSIVYAGTGSNEGETFSIERPGGCGLLRSTDGGTNWTVLAGIATIGARVEKLVVDPVTAGSSTATKVFAATVNKGLLRSTDSGSTWTQILTGGDATDIVIDPSNPQIVYAAIGNSFGASSNGIYKSTDGGATFPTKLAGGFPTSNVGVIKFDVAHTSPLSTLFAAVENPATHSLLGIFKSTDSGATWSQVAASGAFGGTQLDADITLNVDPANASTVYFGATILSKSTDGGATFTILSDVGNGPIHPDFHAFVFQPGNSATIYVGNDGGIFKSTDRGGTWTTLNSELAITQIYPGGALHPSNRNIILAGTQDNGTIKYSGFAPWDEVRRSPSGGILCGDGGFNAIDQSTPTTYYATCSGPDVQPIVYRSDDTGGTWTAKTNGINPSDPAAVSSMVMSPSNSQTLYYGTNKVYKTTDRGETWTPSGTTFQGGNVLKIAPAPSNANIIYIIVPIAPSGLFKSTDGNASYTSIISSDLPAGFVPNSLAVHPTDPNTAFVGYGGSFTPAVLKTTDGGTTWTDISGNLPAIPINAIVLDPSAPTRKILVATHLGVFGTIDGGVTWTPSGVGMPNVIVTDLKYNPVTAELIAFSFGRGAWRATLSIAPSHDFNGDSMSDILWRSANGDVAMWLMNGRQVGSNLLVSNVATSWSIVGQRDFDGDGKADILWRETNGAVAIWLMNGGQVSSSTVVSKVPLSWTIVGTGDFNGDGKADILWRDTNGNVAIWFMNGTKVTSSTLVANVALSWTIVGASGNDIFWRDTSGNTALWIMNGGQVAANVFLGHVTASWSIAGIGDFDGDGNRDILWRDTSGDTAIWLLDASGQATASLFVGNVLTNFSIAETADFDGDGKSDILWRDTSGVAVIWLMNGRAVTASSKFGVTTDWSIQGAGED